MKVVIYRKENVYYTKSVHYDFTGRANSMVQSMIAFGEEVLKYTNEVGKNYEGNKRNETETQILLEHFHKSNFIFKEKVIELKELFDFAIVEKIVA